MDKTFRVVFTYILQRGAVRKKETGFCGDFRGILHGKKTIKQAKGYCFVYIRHLPSRRKMKIRSPYSVRLKLSKLVFWVVLVLLTNGWVDYANQSLRGNSWTKAYDAVTLDDFDTFYEWIAEEIFDVDNAIPEQEGDSDHSGKIVDVKIALPAICLTCIEPFLKDMNPMWLPLNITQQNAPHIKFWDPPPNGYVVA
jgi:hypothetical protein